MKSNIGNVSKNSLISVGGERRLPNMYPDYLSIDGGCVMFRLRYALPYVKRDYRILDLGCGIGWQTKYLSMFCNHVVGVDISEEAISTAVKLNDAANITFLRRSMENLSIFKDAEFDMIVSIAAIEHITKEQMLSMFKELHRVSKPGSVCIGTVGKCGEVGKKNTTRWHLYQPGLSDFKDIYSPYYNTVRVENFKLDTPDLKAPVIEGLFHLTRSG